MIELCDFLIKYFYCVVHRVRNNIYRNSLERVEI